MNQIDAGHQNRLYRRVRGNYSAADGERGWE
jgi:hypothetical protein